MPETLLFIPNRGLRDWTWRHVRSWRGSVHPQASLNEQNNPDKSRSMYQIERCNLLMSGQYISDIGE